MCNFPDKDYDDWRLAYPDEWDNEDETEEE